MFKQIANFIQKIIGFFSNERKRPQKNDIVSEHSSINISNPVETQSTSQEDLQKNKDKLQEALMLLETNNFKEWYYFVGNENITNYLLEDMYNAMVIMRGEYGAEGYIIEKMKFITHFVFAGQYLSSTSKIENNEAIEQKTIQQPYSFLSEEEPSDELLEGLFQKAIEKVKKRANIV